MVVHHSLSGLLQSSQLLAVARSDLMLIHDVNSLVRYSINYACKPLIKHHCEILRWARHYSQRIWIIVRFAAIEWWVNLHNKSIPHFDAHSTTNINYRDDNIDSVSSNSIASRIFLTSFLSIYYILDIFSKHIKIYIVFVFLR